MTSILDFDENSSDSENDHDYVPEGILSDNDSISDEGNLSDEKLLPSFETSKTKKKVRSKQKQSSVKPDEKSHKTESPVEQKAKADEVWKSFLEEVEKAPQNEHVSNAASSSTSKTTDTEEITTSSSHENSSKKSLKEIFEFAGETISVSKECSLNNHSPSEAELSLKADSSSKDPDTTPSLKRKGLQSVLGTILNKKQKINTLQKSLIDWKSYKMDEGITEELETFNRGKGGFIERQRFLERSNVRSYEVDRDIRMSKTKRHAPV